MAQDGAAVSLRDLLAGHGREDDGLQEQADDADVPSEIARAIIDAGELMDRRGWVPATAGNISHRLDSGKIAITRSGCHKGYLTPADVMLVDEHGSALSASRPSAETLLHCQIFGQLAEVGAVVHGHSVAATVLSMLSGDEIRLQGYEVQKAFPAQRSHEATIVVPVFDNDQDIGRLALAVAPHFGRGMPAGYLIRGHGSYAWGPDMSTALARLEALEFLLTCEVERLRHR